MWIRCLRKEGGREGESGCKCVGGPEEGGVGNGEGEGGGCEELETEGGKV